MPEAKTIRIRPLAIPDPAHGGTSSHARLSIEVNGRTLPLAKYIEIVGEIVPLKTAGWRRDTRR